MALSGCDGVGEILPWPAYGGGDRGRGLTPPCEGRLCDEAFLALAVAAETALATAAAVCVSESPLASASARAAALAACCALASLLACSGLSR